MKNMPKYFLISILCLQSFLFAESLCQGEIMYADSKGLHVSVSHQNQNECWSGGGRHQYYIKTDSNEIHFKLVPPNNKIYSNQGKDFLKKECPRYIKILELAKKDSITLRWVDSKFMERNSCRIPPGSVYAPFTKVQKGQTIIIDIPCLDMKSARLAMDRPFNISKKIKYPILRCEIAPATQDNYQE